MQTESEYGILSWAWKMELIMALHMEGDELFFSEVRWKIRLYRQQNSFYDVDFSLDFPPSQAPPLPQQPSNQWR